MSDAPAATERFPVLHRSVVPVTAERHGAWSYRPPRDFRFAAATNAIPLTADEFAAAQASLPIVFLPGAKNMPIALVGMQPTENVFVAADGRWHERAYIPAYVRRYPFLLARPSARSSDLALCLDETAPQLDRVGPGNLFSDGKPSETLSERLSFCRRFEEAVQRTRLFAEALAALDLFTPAEMTIAAGERPLKLNGFMVVNEERVRKLVPGKATELLRNGLLGLIYAHWFSFDRLRGVLAGAPQAPAGRL